MTKQKNKIEFLIITLQKYFLLCQRSQCCLVFFPMSFVREEKEQEFPICKSFLFNMLKVIWLLHQKLCFVGCRNFFTKTILVNTEWNKNEKTFFLNREHLLKIWFSHCFPKTNVKVFRNERVTINWQNRKTDKFATKISEKTSFFLSRKLPRLF